MTKIPANDEGRNYKETRPNKWHNNFKKNVKKSKK